MSVSLLLGLTVYAYIPLAAARHPPMNWGEAQSLSGFLSFLKREPFYLMHFVRDLRSFNGAFGSFALSFPREFTPVGIILLALGLWASFKRNIQLAVALSIVFVGNLASILVNGSYNELFHWHRYYIPNYLVGFLWIGFGITWLHDKIVKNRWGSFAFAIGSLALPAFLFAKNFPLCNRSSHYFAYDYGENILKTLPPNAILFAGGDNQVLPLAYLQMAEHMRPDVTIQDRSGDSFHPLYRCAEFNERQRDSREEEIITNTQRPIYLRNGET